MAIKHREILIFAVEDQRFAIDLHSVVRVTRAQAVTKLANTVDFVDGVIDYHGEVIAVVNFRCKLGYPVHEIMLSDRLIIVQTSERKLVLVVDDVEGIMQPKAENIYDSKEVSPELQRFEILRDDNGIIIVYDIEKIFSDNEALELSKVVGAS